MKKVYFLLLRIVWIIVITAGLVGSAPSSFVKAKPGPLGNSILEQELENSHLIHLPLLQNGRTKDWATVGANPQRTSWTPEEVGGWLSPIWYKPFEPYIPPKVQIITAYNTLYISTSAGLYALDAGSGSEKWVYPTEMPLGHSPTIYQGVAYAGGHDRRLHAVDAYTGQGLWMFEAAGGFSTNPLVVDGIIYIGSRDGYFYAVHAKGQLAGQLMWKYKTNGPIDFSAAYKDGVVYFASNDSHAYALEAQTGSLVWKSAKLPGAGFHSWWPVIYRDWVIFPGSMNYRRDWNSIGYHDWDEIDDMYPNRNSVPVGTLVGQLGTQSGDWVAGTPTLNMSTPNPENNSNLSVTDYFETKPWRRTYFVINRATGEEYTTDFDQDGNPEYAPILWQGTHSGNRYPPVVGSDGVIYQANNYMSDPYIPGGQVTGWQVGSPYISLVSADWTAVDEPLAYSAGGDRIYWNLCCDRELGSYNVHIPYEFNYDSAREGKYVDYNLKNLIPGYDIRYYAKEWEQEGLYAVYGSESGVYGIHGDQNPPIPYNGRVYMHRSNAVIAFGLTGSQPVSLPIAETVDIDDQTIPSPSTEQVRASLVAELEKMLDAGHLRPGYHGSGTSDAWLNIFCGDNLGDYWHNPAETVYTLIRALPFISEDLQTRVKSYLQAEFAAYPPHQYTHIGWQDSAAREIFTLPPEVEAERVNYGPGLGNTGYDGWFYNPYGFYALWKYGKIFGDAKSIFDTSKNLLESAPPDDYLIANPHVHNAYIAGYLGYLELEKLASYAESTSLRQELDRLYQMRATTFSKDGLTFDSENPMDYCRTLNVSRNFLYLVPELGQYLHDNALDKANQALIEYDLIAPYWFVSNHSLVFGEGATNHWYDYHTLFQAKAYILLESRDDLAKHLDVPAVAVGDLYYIDNLIAMLEAESDPLP